jgi:hypothetical protein
MRFMNLAAMAFAATLFVTTTAKADNEGILGSGYRTDNPTFGGGVGLTAEDGQLGSGNRTLVYLAPGIGAGVGEVGENGILGSGTIILIDADGSIVVAY